MGLSVLTAGSRTLDRGAVYPIQVLAQRQRSPCAAADEAGARPASDADPGPTRNVGNAIGGLYACAHRLTTARVEMLDVLAGVTRLANDPV